MITVFGSINVDVVIRVARLPRPGETVIGPSYRMVAGGKGANQAVAAARAGAPVRMVGCVGRDPFAELALATLVEVGVDLTAVERSDAPTGCASIAVTGDGENLITVASGANLRAAADQVPATALRRDATVLMQMEVRHEENWALIRRARAADARIILNLAPAAAVPLDMLSALDVLIVNENEARATALALGAATDDAEAAARHVARRIRLTTIVTLGSAGAAAYAADGAWRVGALALDAVDTTAAGDAFVGAFAAAFDQGVALPRALHRAAAAGSLACGVEGAQPSLPGAAAIEQALHTLAAPRPRRAA